ncbi:MAG: tRNA (cytidine(34)-2'-O)-methyltransferase [Erysipelotrichaceae bacterium]
MNGKQQLHLVLYQPEIPQNTGNMMRTCVASNTVMHLIKPLGFSFDEKRVRRVGMDYIHSLNYHIYENWEDFINKNSNGSYYFLTRYGQKTPSEFNLKEAKQDLYFVVGRESTGIDKHILHDHLDTCMRLPMVEEARCLNVSNTAAIILYEALRQLDYQDLIHHETIKGEDFLNNY